IPAVAKIALENDTYCHVDAAFGGFVIPFLKNPAPFDFAVEGVSAISLDPHKMGMSSIPCGCLLLSEPEHFGCLNVDTPYLTVKKECTLAGTRPGADVAGAYAVIKLLGREGFQAVVDGCMENTRRLVDGMEAFGYKKILEPVMNVAAFTAGKIPEGWKVSHTRAGHLRFVIMPHVTRDVIENFLSDVSKLND
ncbi:MAG: pyridoxal-dependent decarboxylase, partial [Methanocorpusculum sp.]|nr:pyridoxal-dependent decarboxylase [Methanocorpusculum sp.]